MEGFELWEFGLERLWKCCLTDHPIRDTVDSGAEGDLNCGGLAQDFSEEKTFSMLSRDPPCDILVKNVAAFCPCLKSLPEAKVKRFGLIPLAKEISK